jgi:hypothetical protein
MEALGLAGGLHGELVATLEKGAVEAGDPNLQAQLWAMTARLLEDPLGARRDAIEAWRRRCPRARTIADAFLAWSGCCRGRRARRAGRRAGEAPRDRDRRGERKAIAKRIAVLYEDALKQREQAVRAWETVLEIDPRTATRWSRWRSCTWRAARSAS